MTDLLAKAIEFAATFHAGQVDKAGEPYILHPLRVMLACKSENERIAAVLHDIVEDCDVGLDRIDWCFGATIAEAVDCLTRRNGEDYATFIGRCRTNPIARVVKMADLRDNMNMSRLAEITAKDMERHNKYGVALVRLSTPSTSGEGKRG